MQACVRVCACVCVYVCVVCARSELLGLSTGDVKDWQISASSTFPSDCHQRYARLHLQNGYSWCARYKAATEWLQVDLGLAAKVPLGAQLGAAQLGA